MNGDNMDKWTANTFEPGRKTRFVESATLLTDLDLAGIDETGHISEEGRRDVMRVISCLVDSLGLIDWAERAANAEG